MEDIEKISEEEFNYLIANKEELKLFIQVEHNRQLLTDEQYTRALDVVQ